MKLKAYLTTKKIISAFRDVYPDIPMSMILVFLEVAREEGLSVRQIEQRCGIGQASASRSARGLTQWLTADKPGLDLCEFRPCPKDFRSKLLFLNDKGRELVFKIESAVNTDSWD